MTRPFLGPVRASESACYAAIIAALCRARDFVVSIVAAKRMRCAQPLHRAARGFAPRTGEELAAAQVGEEVADAAGVDPNVADPDAADRAHVDDRAAACAQRPRPHHDIVLEPEEAAGVDRLEDAV